MPSRDDRTRRLRELMRAAGNPTDAAVKKRYPKSDQSFFGRKAIECALRERSKNYPKEVFSFLDRVGDRASGLTRREGSRSLPEELQAKLRRSMK